MVDPVGSAARIDPSVQSPSASEEVEALGKDVEAPEVGTFLGGVDLDGPLAVPDALGSFDDPDEQPVSNAIPVPNTAKKRVALLTVA